MDDEYFEVYKRELSAFEKKANYLIAKVHKRNIAMAAISLFTSAALSTKGYNPFASFVALFGAPIVILICSDIKILTKIKRERSSLMRSMNEARTPRKEHKDKKDQKGKAR